MRYLSRTKAQSTLFLAAILIPFFMFAAEESEATVVNTPINLLFPLLPDFTIIIDGFSSTSEATSVIYTGADGIMGLLRVSVSD